MLYIRLCRSAGIVLLGTSDLSYPPGMPATFELKEEAVPKETGRRVEERPLFGEGELATNDVEHH